jgi:hypothetical protein
VGDEIGNGYLGAKNRRSMEKSAVSDILAVDYKQNKIFEISEDDIRRS